MEKSHFPPENQNIEKDISSIEPCFDENGSNLTATVREMACLPTIDYGENTTGCRSYNDSCVTWIQLQ